MAGNQLERLVNWNVIDAWICKLCLAIQKRESQCHSCQKHKRSDVWRKANGWFPTASRQHVDPFVIKSLWLLGQGTECFIILILAMRAHKGSSLRPPDKRWSCHRHTSVASASTTPLRRSKCKAMPYLYLTWMLSSGASTGVPANPLQLARSVRYITLLV
jgi:hypothetical protein